MRNLIAAVLLLCCTAVLGMPAWYKCDATNCTSPSCMCASNSAPGGLSPADTPQFILITHDDAINPFSNKVMRSITDGHKNPNGCNVPATWFTLQLGTDCVTAKRLWEHNHEIALHTVNHTPLSVGFVGDMKKEMMDVRTWLNTTCGIPLDEILGYRTPYLVSNARTRKIIHDAGLLYDASMISVFQNDSEVETAPGQRVWPFTMDAGIPINCNWNFPDGQCNGTTEKYDALWEVPLWELQNAAGDHLFTMDPTGDVYGMMVENFNMNYQNNRAPFGMYVHATWFNDETTAAANKFLEWALAQPNVWAVTNTELIRWLQAPVPASQMNEWYTCNPVDLTQPSDEPKCQLYTTQAGDSSYSIATTFAVLTSDLLAVNPLLGDGSKLNVGQELQIPPWDETCVGDAVQRVSPPGKPYITVPAAAAAGPSAAAIPTPTTSGTPSTSTTTTNAPTCRTHTVVKGDTWTSIGAKYNVDVEEAVSVNPGHSLDSSLTLGDTLLIPPYPASCVKGGATTVAPKDPAAGKPFDVANPSSGVNITMLLAGRPQVAFQTDLKGPFVAATARALGVDPIAVQLISVTSANRLGGRRMSQAVDPSTLPEVTVILRVGSPDPVGLNTNSTEVFALDGEYNTEVLPLFQLSMVQEPSLLAFQNYKAMEIGADGLPIESTYLNTSGTGNDGHSSTSGLSTGAIAGIAVGGVAAVALVVTVVFLCHHRAQSQAQAEVEPSTPEAADGASQFVVATTPDSIKAGSSEDDAELKSEMLV